MKNLQSILDQNITVEEMLNGKQETPSETFIKMIHDLPRKDIAKQIRKDLKLAFKGFKFSVTVQSYAGGGSIDIKIVEGNIEFHTEEYKEYDQLNDFMMWEQFRERGYETYTTEGKKVMDEVKAIHDKYNHNNSDSMTDYFDVNYYGDVKIGNWDKKYVNKKAS